MFSPILVRYRQDLRETISEEYPGIKAQDIFEIIKHKEAPVITFRTISEYCSKKDIPFAEIKNIFQPYDVNIPVVNLSQWTKFFNDGFPDFSIKTQIKQDVSEKQKFILHKFIHIMNSKFGSSTTLRWNSLIMRNPPNTGNKTLRISALCRLFEDTNLPFDVTEFLDALFAFNGQKSDAVSFEQYVNLFRAFT